MDNIKIGQFISERRKDLGLTQQQLAEQLGVSNKAISKWETGEGYPDITIILDLAKALNVTADELLNGEMLQNGNGQNPKKNIKQYSEAKPMSMYTERKRAKKISLWSPICVIAGILMSMFIFMIDLEIDRYSFSAQPNLTPMYIVALAIIIGGFAYGIISKLSQEKFLYQQKSE